MRLMSIVLFIIFSCNTLAETYITYTDVFANQTISLTISQGKILSEEIVVNGRTESGTSILGNTDCKLRILNSYNNVLINIPNNVHRTPWNHQHEGFFKNGDTRILNGPMTINDRPVELLIEIYASE